MAAGGLVAWTAFNNAGIIESLRALAKGDTPPKHPKPEFQPVTVAAATGTATAAAFSSNTIVSAAMKHRGKHPYRYGGGHRSWTCGDGNPLDCSSFVSCALKEVGVLDRILTTGGFMMWKGAKTVPWEQRQAGDLVIWSGHMGIITKVLPGTMFEMIHTGGSPGCPCVVTADRMRNGRRAIARRVGR